MKLALSLTLLVYVSALAAYPDSLKAVEKIEFAISNIGVMEENNYDTLLQQGFEIFKQNNDLNSWLLWHQRLGKAWRNEGNFQKALDCFNEGLNGLWRRPKGEPEYKREAWVYADIGYTYYKKLNDLNKGKDNYEIAGSIFTDTLGVENLNVARIMYTSLGNIYSGLRDIENSRFYHEKARTIYKNLQDWDRMGIACKNIAIMYGSIQDYPKALSALQEGLASIDSMTLDIKMLLLSMTGLNYTHLDDYKQARHYTDWAKLLLDKNSDNLSEADLAQYKYEVYYNYGMIFQGEKHFKEAENFYKKALNIHEKRKGSRRQFVILNLKLGSLYQDWNKPDKAEVYYQKSIDYLMPVLSTVNDPDPILGKALTAEPLLSYAFEGVAGACMSKYEKTTNQNELERAVQYFDLSNEVGLLLLRNYATEGSRFTALKKQSKLKEAFIDAVYKLSLINPNNIWKEKMFTISESSKSFLQLETARLSQNMENWEEQQRLTYYKLKTNLVSLESSIYKLKSEGLNIGDQAIDTLTKAYLETNEAIAKIRNEQIKKGRESSIENYYGEFSVEKIREGLATDQVLIEYFIGENQLYTFCLSKSDFSVYRKGLPADFFQLVDDFRTALLTLHTENYNRSHLLFSQTGKTLYDLLLSDPLSKLPVSSKRLVIVRDGILNFLPFDVLLTKQVDENKPYIEMPYLIKDYSLGYAASASLFYLQQKWEHGRAKHIFAGFAPKYDPHKVSKQDTSEEQSFALLVRDGEFDLKGAQEEVEAAHRILGGKKFVYEQASEWAFKNNASDYQILLLAMHSLVNIKDPNFSKLLFTKGASGDHEDDKLGALELYSMKLQADLAVLSACNTGYGKLQPGEGVMSLSRSFFAAGVPSTVMSLWKVPDTQTKKIMVHFFSYLKEGLSKDEALQQAKLDYLNNINDPKLAHPYFWAGFIPAGNMEPLHIEVSNIQYWWWALTGSILLLITLFFFQRKKHSS